MTNNTKKAERAIVFYSSGISSYCAAKQTIAKFGKQSTVLLFADTGIEDKDNYRFLEESARALQVPLVRVSNSKDSTVFDNWRSRRAIANNRMPFCSFDMKHKPCREWLKQNASMDDLFVVGISWDEIHRLSAIENGWAPNKVWAPLTEPPYLDKAQMLDEAITDGIRPPRLYQYGFKHSNCGGGCVRGGQAHWRHLLLKLPAVFAQWETEEKKMQEFLGRNDIAILKKTVNGESRPFPLSELRAEVENSGQLDIFDWGGCGCFSIQDFDVPND